MEELERILLLARLLGFLKSISVDTSGFERGGIIIDSETVINAKDARRNWMINEVRNNRVFIQTVHASPGMLDFIERLNNVTKHKTDNAPCPKTI